MQTELRIMQFVFKPEHAISDQRESKKLSALN